MNPSDFNFLLSINVFLVFCFNLLCSLFYYSAIKSDKKNTGKKPEINFVVDIINLLMICIIFLTADNISRLNDLTRIMSILVLCGNLGRSIMYYYYYGPFYGLMPVMFNIVSNITNILIILAFLTQFFYELTNRGTSSTFI